MSANSDGGVKSESKILRIENKKTWKMQKTWELRIPTTRNCCDKLKSNFPGVCGAKQAGTCSGLGRSGAGEAYV